VHSSSFSLHLQGQWIFLKNVIVISHERDKCVQNLVGKPEGRPTCRREGNIRINLKINLVCMRTGFNCLRKGKRGGLL
jgi:hypothetical protein